MRRCRDDAQLGLGCLARLHAIGDFVLVLELVQLLLRLELDDSLLSLHDSVLRAVQHELVDEGGSFSENEEVDTKDLEGERGGGVHIKSVVRMR